MSGGKAYKKENRMEEKTKKRPNVLLLLSDQQRYDTIGAAGFPHMHTPNLDRLAGEGVLFEQCHSTNPVCMACRHDLLTGVRAGIMAIIPIWKKSPSIIMPRPPFPVFSARTATGRRR